MEPFEFLLLFAALVLGVAVTDLATSLHRLLSAGPLVRWDWIALLGANVAFLKIVTQWWTWYGRAPFGEALTWEIFLATIFAAILLFLLTASALPDRTTPGEKIDLRAHWDQVHTRYWILFLGHWVVGAGLRIYATVTVKGPPISPWPPGLVIVPASLILMFVGNRVVQTLGLLGFAVIYASQFFGRSLEG
jgi:hypothetical protein